MDLPKLETNSDGFYVRLPDGLDPSTYVFFGAMGLLNCQPSIGHIIMPGEGGIPERNLSIDGSLLNEVHIPIWQIGSSDIELVRREVLDRVNAIFDSYKFYAEKEKLNDK